MSIETKKFIAEVSIVFNEYFDEIDWYSLANIYDLYDEIRYLNEDYVSLFEPDIIINNIYNKDKSILKNFLCYISYRYKLDSLEEIIDKYSFLFEVELSEKFNNISNKKELNMFISYSTKDSSHALKVLNYFENGGLKCFLSGNNLKPSDEYKNKIFEEIYKSDIFFYILSKNSNSSDWCNQEMGMAFMKYKLGISKIFILRVDKLLPHGFLNGFQAESINKKGYLKRIAEEIDNNFGSNIIATIHEKDLNLKIEKLSNVKSYDEAGNILNYISNNSLVLTESQNQIFVKLL